MKTKDFKSKTSDSHEISSCLDLLRRVGFTVFRQNTGGHYKTNSDGLERYIEYNKPGYPDISGFRPTGQAVFWQVKRKGELLSEKKKYFLEIALKNDCLAGYGTCEDLEKELKRRGILK